MTARGNIKVSHGARSRMAPPPIPLAGGMSRRYNRQAAGTGETNSGDRSENSHKNAPFLCCLRVPNRLFGRPVSYKSKNHGGEFSTASPAALRGSDEGCLCNAWKTATPTLHTGTSATLSRHLHALTLCRAGASPCSKRIWRRGSFPPISQQCIWCKTSATAAQCLRPLRRSQQALFLLCAGE